MKRTRKPCYLCERGETRYGSKHGLRLDGVGMVDTACPISKAEYDALVRELREVVRTVVAEHGWEAAFEALRKKISTKDDPS